MRGRCPDESYRHHGLGGLHRATYIVWRNMIARCTSKNHAQFKDYGERGISVCNSWLDSFEAFLTDMGPRPKGMSLDRRDNDGNYEPSNCRWATRREQSLNTSRNVPITARGQTMTAVEWSEVTGVPPKVIRWRLYHGWEHERAVFHNAEKYRNG